MIVRDVKFKDLDAVYNLLNQLKFVFTHQVDKRKAWDEFNGEGLVVEHQDKIIGFGSLVVENKLRGYKSGQLEDIVIHQDWRGKGVGELLVKKLTERADELGCYRVSLFCREELIPFYNKNGFDVNNVVMKRFKK